MNIRIPGDQDSDPEARARAVTEHVAGLPVDEKTLGLEHRYDVKRVGDTAGKHDKCHYFVLDPKHDPIARIALVAYAEAAEVSGYEQLASDLKKLARDNRTVEPLELLAAVVNTDGDRFFRWTADPDAETPWRKFVGESVQVSGATFSWDEMGEVVITSKGIGA